jgi:hypothetical protein
VDRHNYILNNVWNSAIPNRVDPQFEKLCRTCFVGEYEKFWEELIAYFPLTLYGPYRKWHLQQFYVAAGASLASCYLATIRGYEDRRTDTDRIENDASNNFIVVFVAVGRCLQSRCLAMKGGMLFTEPLASNDRRDTHADTQTDGRDLWSTPFILVQAFKS